MMYPYNIILIYYLFYSKYYITEKIYYPYPAKDNIHKYYTITKSGKKVYFGQYSASDFTIHKNEERKNRYILRHEKNESKFWNKSGIDTVSFWSRFYLWSYPTKQEAYKHIKERIL